MGEHPKECIFNKCENLVLKLSKHVVSAPGKARDTDASDFYTFGFYDQLDALPVKNWGDYTPRGIRAHQTSGTGAALRNLHSDSDDLHMLKLYGGKKLKVPKGQEPIGGLFGLLLLNLHDSFTAKHPPAQFVRKFIETTKCDTYPFTQQTLVVAYNTLGYYDIAIVFLAAEWSEMNHFDLMLKNYPEVVANSYIIYGMKTPLAALTQRDGLDAWQDFTVRFTLHPGREEGFGVNLRALLENLWSADELKSYNYKISSGSSDCMLSGRVRQGTLVKMYQPNAVFHPQSPFFTENIKTFRTSLRFNPVAPPDTQKNSDSTGMQAGGATPNMDTLWEQVDQDTDRIFEICRQCGLYERPIHNWAITLREGRILTSHPYSRASVNLLKPIFTELTRVLKQWAEVFSLSPDALWENRCVDFLDTLDGIRQNIGQYIVDLLDSDRFYREGVTLMHRSIASATKLLFSYNTVLNSMSMLLLSGPGKACNDNKDARYHFLITSGGADITTARDLMNLVPIRLLSSRGPDGGYLINESRIILLRLSERSIFDIPGTLFRVFHEGFHFFGNREREFRAESIKEGAAEVLAHLLSRNLCFLLGAGAHDSSFDLPNDAQMSPETVARWRETQQEIVERAQARLKQRLFAGLMGLFSRMCYPDSSIFNYYCEILLPNLEKALVDYFWPRPFSLTGATGLLYPEFLKALDEAYQELSQYAQEQGIVTGAFLNLHATQYYCEQWAQLQNPGPNGQRDFYEQIDARLLQNIYNIQSSLCAPCYGQDFANIPQLLDMAYESYSEAYCDSMSCSVLSVPLEDYLLAFLFEQQKLEFSMPQRNGSFILRLGSVLTMCFGVVPENGLTAEMESRLHARCTFYNQNYIWEEPLDEHNLIQTVNQTLKDYCENPMRQHLETYLAACLGNLKGTDLSRFRTLYQKARTDEIENALDLLLESQNDFAF